MGLLSFIKKYLSKAGISVAYSALLLYYAYKRTDTPFWAKRMIVGSLGYLIAPLDALPDLVPIVGFTDDLSILSYSVVTLASYINLEVRIKARKTLAAWVGKVNLEQLRSIDKKI